MEAIGSIRLVVPQNFGVQDADQLHARLRQELNVDRPLHTLRKAVDPAAGDQLIQLIGSAAIWLPLSTAATAFLTTLAKRAADSLWDAVRDALKRPEVKPLANVSEALATAIQRAGPDAEIVVGLDIPDQNWGTVLFIKDRDPARIAHALALFTSKSVELSSAMKAEVDAGRSPLGRAVISVDGDDLVVRWRSQKGFTEHEIRVR